MHSTRNASRRCRWKRQPWPLFEDRSGYDRTIQNPSVLVEINCSLHLSQSPNQLGITNSVANTEASCRTWKGEELSETSFLGRLAESRGSGIKHQISIGESWTSTRLCCWQKADLKKEKGAIAVVGLWDSSTPSSETELRLANFFKWWQEPVFCPYWHWVNLTTG